LSLAKNVEFLRRLPKLRGLERFDPSRTFERPRSLVETTGFGANPGNLRMFSFVPPSFQEPRALVVVLHGCGQNAASYDLGAGWSTLAQRYGFALLMPEQQLSNNSNGCFNWFNPEDSTRGNGEACSIREMIDRMVRSYHINDRQVFVTGLSAGGAMTSVMLATYPEVFAGGAIIAGLPYGVASNVREALSGMSQSPSRAAAELGELVRRASNHRGRWPKISIWHGGADLTVNPANANEILKQWLDVHRLPAAPMAETTVNGHPRQVWWNEKGETMVESYAIADMAHGTPVGLAEDDERYGAAGAFLIEAGISSSYQIAKFFGLTKRIAQPKAASGRSARQVTKRVPPSTAPDLTSVLSQPGTAAHPQQRENRRAPVDVAGIITRALTTAGLIK
jgi:poly(hydroxyalkanoate) depolymerase family esterase